MSVGLLPEHIGPLVDRLRNGDHQAVSLPDVAALTEVLMRSLESYFKSIDLTIYQECQELADYIDDARLEISSLSPEHSDTVGIPRAGLELEAIVQQTESATNSIMESAEKIMEADTSDMEAYSTTVNDAVMQIFEACSFQDITGQRISKVVSTLEHVESRVSRLVNILGVMDKAKPDQNTAEEDIDEDAALLNGPALEGEGMEQSDIDALLNGKIEDDEPVEASATPEANEAETVAPATEQAVEVAEPVAAVSENASTEDIDFMFAEPSDAAAGNNPPAAVEEVSETVEPVAEVVEAVVETAEPVAEAAEPVAEAAEPVAEAAEPVAEAVEPVAETAEPVAEAVEPVAEAVEPVAETAEPVAEAVAKDVSDTEPNLIEQAKQKKAEAQAKKKAQTPPPKPVSYEGDGTAALDPKSTGNTTQSDIDALFS